MSGEASRAAAVRIGVLVEQGMHLPQAIERVLGRSRLEGSDRGFATELAYGAERWRLRLDRAIAPWLKRPIPQLDPAPRALLRQGAYQLTRLGLPGYAVVHASVEAAASCGAGAAKGLVNAVLRRVAEQGEPELPHGTVERLAVEYAHPEWLVRRWVAAWGEDEARRMLEDNQDVPPIVLRANARRTTGAGLRARLGEAGIETAEVAGLPEAAVIRGMGDVRRLPGWSEGLFQVQDVSAQAVGTSIDPEGAFIEAACGMGTKTLHQAERRPAAVLGVDLEERKVEAARREAVRLGLSARFLAGDARRLREIAGEAPQVLLDAPCSALAVVGRRPDAKWRRAPEDLRRNGQLQLALLRAAYAAVRPGGVLTYSVCSLEPEETTEPVVQFLEESGARAVTEAPALAIRAMGPGFRLPQMFIARIRRVSPEETE